MWKKFRLESNMVKAGQIHVCRVKIEGYLDSSTFPKLQDHLQAQLEGRQYHYLLDFKDLDYISSAGLGVLMGFLKQIRSHNGDLKIVHMSDKIHRVFNLLGFSRLVNTYQDEQEALDSFSKPATATVDLTHESPKTGEEEF